MDKIGICIGVLKEVQAARWWEKRSGKYVDSRRMVLNEFINKYL